MQACGPIGAPDALSLAFCDFLFSFLFFFFLCFGDGFAQKFINNLKVHVTLPRSHFFELHGVCCPCTKVEG